METKTAADMAATDPLLTQANLARIRGNWAEAADLCVRVLRSHPGNADAHSLLGDIYRDQGAVDDALQWYRLAADLRPSGPDPAKLRQLEQVRDRRAALTGPVTASLATGACETPASGTTQLAGYSPKRWLNAMTIISACFLAATLLVLVMLRSQQNPRLASTPRSTEFTSHPMMPTTESGYTLPRLDPNRPTVLPAGEQPRAPVQEHHTGDGLPPDRPGASRAGSLPPFASPQTPAAAAPVGQPVAGASHHEVAPAPVQMVRPMVRPVTVSVAANGEDEEAGQRNRGASAAGPSAQGDEREPAAERTAQQGPGASPIGGPAGQDVTTPARQAGAGGQSSGSDATPPER